MDDEEVLEMCRLACRRALILFPAIGRLRGFTDRLIAEFSLELAEAWLERSGRLK